MWCVANKAVRLQAKYEVGIANDSAYKDVNGELNSKRSKEAPPTGKEGH